MELTELDRLLKEEQQRNKKLREEKVIFTQGIKFFEEVIAVLSAEASESNSNIKIKEEEYNQISAKLSPKQKRQKYEELGVSNLKANQKYIMERLQTAQRDLRDDIASELKKEEEIQASNIKIQTLTEQANNLEFATTKNEASNFLDNAIKKINEYLESRSKKANSKKNKELTNRLEDLKNLKVKLDSSASLEDVSGKYQKAKETVKETRVELKKLHQQNWLNGWFRKVFNHRSRLDNSLKELLTKEDAPKGPSFRQ